MNIKWGEWVKRLTIFVLIFVLLLVGLSSYAESDAGTELENWSERALQIVLGSADSESSSKLKELSMNISQKEKEQLAGADEEIDLLSLLISENSNKEVLKYQLRYISIADETERELAKKNFNALQKEQINKLEVELENDIESILAEVLQ